MRTISASSFSTSAAKGENAMERTTATLVATLLAALAATAVHAAEPVKDASPTPQELQRLVRENNARLTVFRRYLEGMPNWHNDKVPRDPAVISSNVTEMVKLLRLPVGAADAINEAEVQRLAARAYAQPLNLRLFNHAKRHYQEALHLAATPSQKARLAVEFADYMDRAAMEGDRAQWDKAKRDALATPGLPSADRLELLAEGIPGLDFETEGWKVAAGDPALRIRFFELCLGRIAKANAYANNRGGNRLWYGQSDEHKLEIAEKALAEPDVPQRKIDYFVKCKQEALVGLERFDEAENFLIGQAATTNVPRRVMALTMLAEFYVARAQRCFSDPHRPTLEKAVAAYDAAIALQPQNGGCVVKQIAALMQLGRYDDAIAKVDYLVSISRDKVADRQANKLYADCHYYKGDYAGACAYYDKFDDNDRAMQRRYAASLYAVGRYDDAIAHIKRSEDGGSWRAANAYFIRKIEERKAAGR